ncbi:MAG: peptidoglycan DD-metalloendopeptidase family protein [Rhodospirillales bacterium]
MARFPRIPRVAVLGLVSAALAVLAACGFVEWPPPGRGPTDINRPPGSTSPQTSVSAPAFVGAGAVVAGRGDTVYGLARRHRVAVRAIIEANRLRPPYHLDVGQRVVLPRAPRHTVRRGETLYAIARAYGANPYDIARLNGLRPPYLIRAGQGLAIPGRGGVRTAARGAAQGAAKGAVKAPSGKKAPGTPDTSQAPSLSAPRKPPPPALARPPAASGKGFIWPVKGRVLSGFGAKARGLRNDGINIAAKLGAPVRAAENGVVAYAGNELRGFGNLLLIKHAGGWVTAYAHTERMLVKRGDRVRKGQRIATVGATGNVRDPQLHFELRRGRRAKDPSKHLLGA